MVIGAMATILKDCYQNHRTHLENLRDTPQYSLEALIKVFQQEKNHCNMTNH